MSNLASKMGVDELNFIQHPEHLRAHQLKSIITHDIHRTLFGEKQCIVAFDPIFVSWKKNGVWHYNALEPVIKCADYSTWYKCGYRHYEDQDATMKELWNLIHMEDDKVAGMAAGIAA